MFINPQLDGPTRLAIGREIIKYITSRAKQGLGMDRQPMGGPDGDNQYSKNYVKTPEFKAVGKRAGRVNMTLTGDMLDDLSVLDATVPGRIEIGPEQQENKNKIIYLREKGYNVLAISQNEVNKIQAKFDKSTVPTVNISRTIAQSILRGIFDDG